MKEVVRALLSRFGYQIVKADPPGRPTEKSPYGVIFPEATFSPWAADRDFLDAYEAIRDHTLVDIYRCFELWSLVDQSRKLEGALLEVGVWRGGTGALIARRAKLSGIPDRVYLCDTFTGVVKASSKDAFYSGGEHSDTSREQVDRLLRQMRLDNVSILPGVFPDETATHIDDRQFRLCHIDVDVYQSASAVLDWVWARLVVGGVVIYAEL